MFGSGQKPSTARLKFGLGGMYSGGSCLNGFVQFAPKHWELVPDVGAGSK